MGQPRRGGGKILKPNTGIPAIDPALAGANGSSAINGEPKALAQETNGSAASNGEPKALAQGQMAPQSSGSVGSTERTGRDGTSSIRPAYNNMAVQAPKTDATALVGKPGMAPTGKMSAHGASWEDLYRLMNPHKPESDEDREKREKKEKRDAMFSAIGDGISALSNLWFTSQYAPNAYKAGQGMSVRTKERWDKLKAQREANDQAWFEGWLRARAKDEEKAEKERAWNHALEREKKQDALNDAKEKRAAGLYEDQKREQSGKADKAGFEALSAGYEAQNKPKELDLKNQNLEAGVRQKNASATASLASANNSNASAREHNEKAATERYNRIPVYDTDGNLVAAPSKPEVATMRAQQEGTAGQGESNSKTTTRATKGKDNKTTTSSSTTTSTKTYPTRPKKVSGAGAGNASGGTGSATKSTGKPQDKGDNKTKWGNTSQIKW